MNLASRHVLLLTSTNLACNPRCLKEVRLLDSMGAKITVVAFNLHNWTTEKELEINKELSRVEFHYLETTSRNYSGWIVASFIEKISLFLTSYFASGIFSRAMAISKRSWILLQWIKKWKGMTDLIIAHNPPAFYPAYILAENLNKPFALDIEDYHPGEGKIEVQKKNMASLMKELIPEAVYTSYASPLIKEYSERLFNAPVNNGMVINNTFPQSDFIRPSAINIIGEKLKIVWFSQFIDYGRGLEKMLPVLDNFSSSVQLTLIGNLREPFYNAELKGRNYIQHLPSLSPVALNNELVKYDIGLALEDGLADLNRTICLTNKIWAYFQAGLFIIASDTAAQSGFMANFPQHGMVMPVGYEEQLDMLHKIIQQREHIRTEKEFRFEEAKKENWETESVILVREWQKIIE